jgi:hypothetical protein
MCCRAHYAWALGKLQCTGYRLCDKTLWPILHCTALYCTALNCTTLYCCAVRCCAVLYFTVLHSYYMADSDSVRRRFGGAELTGVGTCDALVHEAHACRSRAPQSVMSYLQRAGICRAQ